MTGRHLTLRDKTGPVSDVGGYSRIMVWTDWTGQLMVSYRTAISTVSVQLTHAPQPLYRHIHAELGLDLEREGG